MSQPRRPALTPEMKAAGMEWRNGKRHWKLYHGKELITILPHGTYDPLARNGINMRVVINRRLRAHKGE